MNKNAEIENNNSTEQTRKVINDGELNLVGYKIPCYVLEDGTRVLSNQGMQNALKIDETKRGGQMAAFLTQKSLQPFINGDNNARALNPIICWKGKQKINGYEAISLVNICDWMLEARNNIELNVRQKIVADQCEILVRAFAKTGIIALIDEATGYQEIREKTLQEILKGYIAEEILEWQKTFHRDFYEQIYRLWNIPFTSRSDKRKPQFIGKLTNQLIYENMPNGVLEKIKEINPKTKGEHWRYKFHSWLTPEIGREHLKRVINSVEALASISKTKEEFLDMVEKKYSKTISNKSDLIKNQSDDFMNRNEKETTKVKKPQIGSLTKSFKLDIRSSNEMEEILNKINEKYASRKKINASQLLRAMVYLTKSKSKEEISEAIKETVF